MENADDATVKILIRLSTEINGIEIDPDSFKQIFAEKAEYDFRQKNAEIARDARDDCN